VGPVKVARTRGGEAAFERFDAARRFDLRDRVHPVAVADSPDAFVCDLGPSYKRYSPSFSSF
jgi:hypothetical protein